jgi:hypothetical protein
MELGPAGRVAVRVVRQLVELSVVAGEATQEAAAVPVVAVVVALRPC